MRRGLPLLFAGEGIMIPSWLFVILIIVVSIIFLIILFLIIYILFLKKKNYTPDSFFYPFLKTLSSCLFRVFGKTKVLPNDVDKLEGSFLLFANHHSALDFNYAIKVGKKKHYAVVSNNYYRRLPILGKMFDKAGIIPKKMYTQDIATIRRIMQAKKDGYPILIFPEASLSSDGSYNRFNLSTASLVKKLDIPLVLARISGAYFIKPKWRKRFCKGTTTVEVKRIINREELQNMSVIDIDKAIKEVIYFDEFDLSNVNIRSKNKARGLENILYLCPNCHSYYTNYSSGNDLICHNCGAHYHLKNDYHFEELDLPSISAYYQKMKEIEKTHLHDFSIICPVDVKIFTDNVKKVRKEEGVIEFNSQGITYKRNDGKLTITYKISELEGIAYSVNEEFEFYYQNDLYYFYPQDNRKLCSRIFLLYQLLKEEYGKE